MPSELPQESLGGRIRQLREAEGLSLGELAEVSGISKSYLWNLENKEGHQKPSADTLYALAQGSRHDHVSVVRPKALE